MKYYEDGGVEIMECETFAEFEAIHTDLSLRGYGYEDVGNDLFLYYSADGLSVRARVRAPAPEAPIAQPPAA